MKYFWWLILLFSTKLGGQEKGYFINPILAGFYPDPSICRAGNDYYIVNSSFAYFPGLPIFHSKDLVSWEQIGHALDRPEQLNLDGAGVSRGLFAPTITFHKGTFYIVCTLIDKLGNFVITATNPKGPWSNPVALPEVDGIDPSLYIEEDGKAFLLYNSIPPDNIPLYDGHRTIRIREFDLKTLGVKGEEKILINGGTDINKKPVWIEGPHIIRKDGWYYLLCAEGGTGYNHSEVVFRSKSIYGPYKSYEKNPILTQRHLDPKRKDPVTTTGHADIVDTKDGKWVAVFLGCRPYEGEHYNTGRETFMAPVTWKDGWPHIIEGNETVKYQYPFPLKETLKANNPYAGNIFFRDEFDAGNRDPRWIYLRTPVMEWHTIDPSTGLLAIHVRKEKIGGKSNPSFLAFRQQNLTCTASTALRFKPGNREKAGLAIFQSEKNFYFFGITNENESDYLRLYRSTADSNSLEVIASKELNIPGATIYLRARAERAMYVFEYSDNNLNWKPVSPPVDAKFLSTKTAGGFVGTVLGLYVTGEANSGNKAFFDWFDYRGR